MSEQKLTGRCLSERELSARMNCAEMIEIRDCLMAVPVDAQSRRRGECQEGY